ncbi:ABC transporter substrate-binding protein [Microbulbifer guangxiensis]|uniref:ABC transporter substrate-binding protein n=1 Tax=Microbulbifer guangxiensis TaxID=2904249 RepID=UPI001F1F7C04|nr:sugar ABC transporter substrate-binding protein [Microbulbifer guangxiensis]
MQLILGPVTRLIAVGVAALFSACVSAATQIQFWTMQLSPFHDEYVNGLIAEFERQNPDVRVKWVDVPWKEMEKKVLASVAARTAPDLVNLNPQFAAKLAQYGALADPERFLAPEEIDAYLPNIWQANRFRGQSFAIPWYLSTTVTIFNRELLEAAGAKVPSDHIELLDTAKRIRTVLDKYAYFPAMDGSHPMESLVAMGVPLVDAGQSAVGFDNEAGEAFFRYYRDLYQQGLIPRNVLTEGHRKAVDLFQSGEVAMITTGMQFLNNIRINSPDLFEKIGIAPQLKVAGAPFNVAVMNLAVPALSKNKEAAFRFATFVTNHENQMALAHRVPLMPSTAESYRDPFFSELDPEPGIIDRARLLSARQILEGGVLVPPLPNYSKLKTSFVYNLQSAMLGRLTVDEALDETVETWALFLGGSDE